MDKPDKFSQINKIGLGVDIDETLSWTMGHWVKELQKLFGNPENLSIQELVDKYGYAQNVPYWRSEAALKWMEEKIHSNEFQKELPLIENSNHFLNKINEIIPIAAYITMRPESVEEGTKHWLKKHNFPEAPIISRPSNILVGRRSKWKAGIIEKLFPKIIGIIDDSPNLIEALSKDYKGTIFFYNQNKIETKLKLIQCKDWAAIYREVKNVYGKID